MKTLLLLINLLAISEFSFSIGGNDISAFTLLGVVTSSGGCQPPEVSHSVKYSKQSDEYFYELKVKVNGLCEPNHLIEIWCTIAKISDSSTVAFSKQE